jgi:transposase-like protein
MTCLKCRHGTAVKAGTTNAHTPRFRCNDCGARFTAPQQNPLGGHTTSVDDAVKVFTLLSEGMSVRAVSRVTGIHKGTILSLLLTVGTHCARLFDAKVQNMHPRFVQADEAWTFVQKKQRRLKVDDPSEFGDQCVWIGIDSETKAVLSYRVGKRDAVNAYAFIGDLLLDHDSTFDGNVIGFLKATGLDGRGHMMGRRHGVQAYSGQQRHPA